MQRLPTEHWGEREIAMMLSQAFIWCAQYESVAPGSQGCAALRDVYRPPSPNGVVNAQGY